MDHLLWMRLLALPVTAVLVLMTPPAVMARRRRWPRIAVGLWMSGLLFLVLWVATTLQAAVRADEAGSRGDVFGTVWWLVLAALAGVVSVAVAEKDGAIRQR